jgi:cell shape-determining protein MreC
MEATAHQMFMQALREGFETAGYNNEELNEIVFNQLNQLNDQVQELLELEKKMQVMTKRIQELQSRR